MIDYKALAGRVRDIAEGTFLTEPERADLRTLVSLLEGVAEQAKADAVTGYSMLQWIKLTDRMPNPHGRVLIFTEGYDFNGEQVFDVKAETLNECFYADPDDQPEVCRVASHWMPHPTAVLKGESEPTEAQITERHVAKAYALCPSELATPARYRWMANYLNDVLRAALAAREQ